MGMILTSMAEHIIHTVSLPTTAIRVRRTTPTRIITGIHKAIGIHTAITTTTMGMVTEYAMLDEDGFRLFR